ncbi:MAG: hypothetical protein K6E29_07565 [Cyanobacteria bacterium RUI128]|nr:hypothetical protein [Cyanobacteria bacterium RUI128]
MGNVNMMNYNKEKTIIDLSDASNISDLGIKLTNILETEGIAGKELYLNLGNTDLKQSQLLSIKALIEAMQSSLCGVETTSEMTETSAIGLGLSVEKPTRPQAQAPVIEETPSFSETFKQEQPAPAELNSNELSSFNQLKNMNSIGDFVTASESTQEAKINSLNKETQETVPVNNEVEEPQNLYESMEKEISAPDSIESALDVTFGIKDEVKEKTEETDETDIIFPQQMFPEQPNDYESTETIGAEDGKYVLLDTEGITPEGLELIKANTSDLQTLYLTQTLRSGQTVSYEGNIFLIGDAHPGSEINATGDITVWGILGGIVHAGAKGNTEAKVRALKLNPIQLRIAHLYSRRNDTVNVPYVQKSNEFTPEEARIEKEQIVIYKTLRRED